MESPAGRAAQAADRDRSGPPQDRCAAVAASRGRERAVSPSRAPLRYERKFVVTGQHVRDVIRRILTHPSLFRQKYPPRFVNSLYLDTWELPSFRDNTDGNRDRRKVRIRWYGDLTGEVLGAQLELKIKRGLLGRKLSYPLPPFRLGADFGAQVTRRILAAAALPAPLRLDATALDPVLLNRYLRRYFESHDGAYRVTVDDRLEYYRVDRYRNAFLGRWTDGTKIVVELKYGPEADPGASAVAHGLGLSLRLTRNSKFAHGVGRIYGGSSWTG